MVDYYYKILECSRSSTPADIKKAYRRLALKWHPDKNPDNQEDATKKFKEVSEAYEVLSDEKKRKIYDQFGKEGLSASSGGSGGGGPTRSRTSRSRSHYDPFDYAFPSFTFRDPEEVFREFFGGDPLSELSQHFHFDPFDAFGHHNRMRRQRPRQRGSHGSSAPASENDYSLSNNFFGGGNSFQPFGGLFGFPFGDFGPFEGGGSTGSEDFPNMFRTAQTFSGGSANPSAPVKRSSTSTKYVDGKKVTTKKVIENGKETITVLENDIVISKTVNSC